MRWKCTCSYDGTNYAGWQIQPNQISVQQVVEEALQAILKEHVPIHGSGRTDSGVHALEQVFHFDFDWSHSADSLVKAVQTKLPRSVRIDSAEEVEDDFHARFSAVLKRYHYRLFIGEADPFLWPFCWSVQKSIDLNILAEATHLLMGEFDFAAFAANRGADYESTVRHMTQVGLKQDSDFVYLTFEANGFMYKMVRSLVGTLVNVALGRMKITDVENLIKEGHRSPMVLVAPAQGLFLEKVFY